MASRKKKMTKDNISNHFELRNVKPLTANQQDTFRAYDEGKNLVLHGYAGTGKSFVSLYLALEEILDYRTPFNKVVIIRSVVPSRDMGFLPGSIKEKIKVYEEPYKEIVKERTSEYFNKQKYFEKLEAEAANSLIRLYSK